MVTVGPMWAKDSFVELVLSFNLYVGSVDQIEVPRLVLQVPLPCPLIYCYHIICIGTHGGK